MQALIASENKKSTYKNLPLSHSGWPQRKVSAITKNTLGVSWLVQTKNDDSKYLRLNTFISPMTAIVRLLGKPKI
jgi:hypothetical protein